MANRPGRQPAAEEKLRDMQRRQHSWRDTAVARLATLPRKPPMIVRQPGVTAHAQIEDWLADEITVGHLSPGDRLPTEHDLAAWLGVSRMTLRQALSELAQRGLVTRAVGRGGGTFVAEPKLEQDLTTLAGFSEQLRRYGKVAGAACSPRRRSRRVQRRQPRLSCRKATRCTTCGASGWLTDGRS